MKTLPIYVACVLAISGESNAQIQIPGVRIPEIGVRTDPITIPTPPPIVAPSPIPTPKLDIPGDLRNPGRIVDNVGREITNLGREVDRVRLEAMAQASAPALASWLTQSRNDALRGGASPIPTHIRRQFTGFYDEDILNRVRFKVGDTGVANLGNLSLDYGDRAAVVLIDVVVFKNRDDAQNNIGLWSHELKHVAQYRDWGVGDFAIRYLRSWNGVEGEAVAAEGTYQNWSANRTSTPPPENQIAVGPPPRPATMCATPYGACGMAVAVPQGSTCYCPSYYGPLWGTAQ